MRGGDLRRSFGGMHKLLPSRWFNRPSPAFALASAALFVSLGGGAYAAASLPAHSVGARQLKANSLTSPARW